MPGLARRSPSKLPKQIRTLGWISFFTDIASEMAYPVVPLFLTAVLGAPVAVLGAMEGVAEALVCVMKGVSGWHCDSLGKRTPYVRVGYGLSALSKPLMALAGAWPLVFLVRITDRLGKGVRTTARDALIVDAIQDSAAGRAFGFHRMMDSAGAVIGVSLSLGLLLLLPGQYRTIFLLTALPGAGAIFLSFRLRDVARTDDTPQCRQRIRFSESLRGLPKHYWRSLVILGIFAFANSTDALLLLRAKGLGFSDVQVMAAYILFNLVYAASAYPAGVLSDRFGRWRMILGGWVLYALIYYGFAAAPSGWLWGLFPLYGLFMGMTEGVGKALVSSGLPAHQRGSALGFFFMVSGLMTLAGSLVAGIAWDLLGPQAPFYLGSAAAALAVVAGTAVMFRSSPGRSPASGS